MSDAGSSGSRRVSPAPRGLGSKMARIFGSTASFKKDETPPEPPRHFNPEEHTAEKREWTRRQQQQQQQQQQASAYASSTASEDASPAAANTSSTTTTNLRTPRMYEHFCIVGLPPTTDVKAVSADIKTYHTARRASTAGVGVGTIKNVGDLIDIVPDTSDSNTKQYGIKGPVLSAQVQVLTTFPASSQLPDDLADNVAAFCFPHGVRPELLERTPSMSGLNEVVFGQPYQTQSDHSFVFRMSVADPGDPTPRPLYGVCCYARELVHRPPALARDSFPQSTAPLARYMVTAPRCYCLLTRYPFFDLHFKVLHTVLGLERLERMATFADEVALGLVTSSNTNTIMRYSSVNDSTNATGTSTSSTASIAEEETYAALGIHHHHHSHQQNHQSTTSGGTSSRGPGHIPTSTSGTEVTPSSTATTTASNGRTTTTTATSSTCTSDSDDDDGEVDEGIDDVFPPGGARVGHQEEMIGLDTSSSTGFATPMHASTEEREIDLEDETEEGILENKNLFPRSSGGGGGGGGGSNSKKKMVHLSRGLSEGTECEGLSPVASTSSLGSDLAATPSAPLLPATPYYTPAPNFSTTTGAAASGNGGGRRMTKYHGAVSPGPAPPLLLEVEDSGNAIVNGGGARGGGMSGQQQEGEDLLGRMESVKQLLDESLSELDTRLQPSPPLLLPHLEKSQTDQGQLESVDLISSSLDLGNWVGATDSQGEPVSSSGNDPELNGLDDSLAALLTLETPTSTATQAEEVVVVASEGITTKTTETTTTLKNNINNRLDALDVLQQYLETAVPRPGESIGFQPDPALQPILYQRPASIATLRDLGLRVDAPALPDIDAAANLSAWTISALCQSLSLENILTFFTAVLLERQVVLFCPNVGVLCGVALSLVPLLLPFSWQSLLLPVLPATASRLDLLEAPVPFVVGVLFKTQEVRSRCGGLVRVNIYKDRVRNAGSMPALPNAAALAEALAGSHAQLQRAGRERAAAARPVHVVSETQAALAQYFAATLQKYLKSLVADLKGYTITDVSEGSGEQQRVSVLLKESFLESFPPRDRAFMRQFAETQMFSVYCDSVLG